MNGYEGITRLDWTDGGHYLGDGIYSYRDVRRDCFWLRTDRDSNGANVIGLDYRTLKGLIEELYRQYPNEMTEITEQAKTLAPVTQTKQD